MSANSTTSLAGGASAGPILGLRTRFRRLLAVGLYRIGLMAPLRKIAWTHQIQISPRTYLPSLRRSTPAKFGILCYHRVGTEGVPLFSRLPPRTFEAQMSYLRKHYRIISLAQLCLEASEPYPSKPAIVITFDDGYGDLYYSALPVLQKYKIPATVYLISNCLETGEAPWYDRIFVALDCTSIAILDADLGQPRRFALTSFEARKQAAWEIVCYLRSIPDVERRKWCAAFDSQMTLPKEKLTGRMLDWPQVHAMQREGIFFGAHTKSHPVVSRLAPSNLEAELSQSKRYLENGLNASVDDFAYPFGKPQDCGCEAEKFLARSGYRSAVTTSEGVNLPNVNLLRLRRMQIGDDTSLPQFAFNVAQMFLEFPEDVPSHLTASSGGKGPAALTIGGV